MSTSTTQDERWAMTVAKGDGEAQQQAFFQLYEAHSELVERFIRSRVHSSMVADVFQEVWAKAWDRAASFRGGNYKAWLMQLCRNIIIDTFRYESRRDAKSIDSTSVVVPGEDSAVLSSLLADEEVTALHGCLSELDDDSRALVKARLGGEGYDSVCETLGVTSARAHKLLFKAKRRLADCVQGKLGS